MEKIIELNGAILHIVPTKKFKNITISIKLKSKLKKETSTIRTLLSFMFSGGTNKLPSQQAISKYLENLYGMRLGASVSSKGKAHIIHINSIGINDEYLPEKEGLLVKQLELLHDVLFDLSANSDQFNETIFNSKKRELKQRLISAKNDKYSYAVDSTLKLMGKDQCLGISSIGYEEDLDSITNQALYDYYQKCIKEDEVEIYVVGDIKEEEYILFEKYLSFTPKKKSTDVVARYRKTREDILKIEEIQDITQAKLNIGYEINTAFIDFDHYAFTVFNGMFGGFAHSKLFKVVREEHSLCYYISSNYDAFNSIMLVTAGIDASQSDKVIRLVEDELDKFKHADISKDDFEVTKIMLLNGLKKSNDEAGNIIALKYNRDIVAKQETIEEYMEKLNHVTLADIQRVATKVKLDTIYLLKGSE